MKNRLFPILLMGLAALILLWITGPAAVTDKEPAAGPSLSCTPNPVTPPPASQTPSPPFTYEAQLEETPSGKLSYHLLKLDSTNPLIEIKPVTAFATLFGYETLSVITEKYEAMASVNGGFSYVNGLLGGLLYSDGRLKSFSGGRFPLLTISGEGALLSDYTSTMQLLIGNETLEVVSYNKYPEGEGIYVFTPDYGSRNRVDRRQLAVISENGLVKDLLISMESVAIPENGFLVTAIGKTFEKTLQDIVERGASIDIKWEVQASGKPLSPSQESFESAYELGSWIIRDKKLVIGASDPWVGTMESRAPRTAVGILEDGLLAFFVVDGRQEGLSNGLTGRELGEKLLALGFTDAALLDGGASSEMIVEGDIVNSPSAGRERKIPVAFVIRERTAVK